MDHLDHPRRKRKGPRSGPGTPVNPPANETPASVLYADGRPQIPIFATSIPGGSSKTALSQGMTLAPDEGSRQVPLQRNESGIRFEQSGAQAAVIIQGTVNSVGGNQHNIINNTSDKEKRLKAQHKRFDTLNRVPEAAYNSSARETSTGCHENTRIYLLETIHNWVATDGTLLFWLNGEAGMGKTTIAHSIAEYYNRNSSLGASFFFSRDQQVRRQTKFLFQTMAFQLGNAYSALKARIGEAMKDQQIVTSNLQTQLRKLILGPVSTSTYSFSSPVVFVLDALDECEEADAVSRIIKLLVAELENKVLPLKFFVTSRPERHLRSIFLSRQVNTQTLPFALHDIGQHDIQRDIRLYVESELEQILDDHSIIFNGDSWPDPRDTEALVQMAGGLFIVASTALKFIRPDRAPYDPRKRMTVILNNRYTGFSNSESRPFRSLDALYTQLLDHAFQHFPPADGATKFRMIVGTILLAFGRLSRRDLGRLLQMEDDVDIILAELHSVLLVPPGHKPVRAFHPSFHDYLTNQTRCENPKYFVDPPIYHTEICRICLQKMISCLKRDICRIDNTALLNVEVRNLEGRVKKYLPGDLQYACQFWAFHLRECTLEGPLIELITVFAFGSILHWIEVLSLLGWVQNPLDLTGIVLAKLMDTHRPRLDDSELIELLQDTRRLLSDFSPLIADSALQVYQPALRFTPEETLLYRTFAHELEAFPHVSVNQWLATTVPFPSQQDVLGVDVGEGYMYNRDGHDSFTGPSYNSTYSMTPDGPALHASLSNTQLASANSAYISQTPSAGHVDETRWPWWNLCDYDPSIPLRDDAYL